MPELIANGRRLDYRWIDAARAGAPTLVFLHEGLGSVELWKDFPDRVAEATGCGTLVYSRYGYGRSDRLEGSRGVDYMHVEALEALPAVLADRGIENPILIGHSDGASIALIHAGAGRWPVRALILEAPHVFVEDITVASIAEAKTVYETTDLGRRLGRYHADADNTFWGWNDIWLHPDFRAWNIEEYLPGVRCPTLLIQGEDDEYGTFAQLDAIEARVAGPVETVKLPSCKHSPHRDQPGATLDAMARFIAAQERSPR
ncbi:MAG TPA: alpha/beta hydrolase [Alphaproteobacteria bacterium]|nr:alpha/beta hydrolase [Alphaproteobacteria bacterium]